MKKLFFAIISLMLPIWSFATSTYTATLQSTTQNGTGPITFNVQYDNGAGKVVNKTYLHGVPIGTYLEDQIAAEENYLVQIDSETTAIQGKVGKVIVPSTLIVHIPTQDEIDRNNFFAMKSKLEALQIAVDKGLVKADDAGYLQLIQDYKAAFKQEYTLDPRWK